LLILGIDPGTATTGYGLVQVQGSRYTLADYGCIRTRAHIAPALRLEMIYQGAHQLLAQHKPQAVAIEQLFFNRNTTNALSVAQARGVLLLAFAKANLPISEYTPLQVKQAVVGYGRAEKEQVKYMVSRILGLKTPLKSDDAADALAIAICHGQQRGSALLLAGGQRPEDRDRN
jgi:crossover junction endodeoxyribonuclease RuvC